MNAATRGVVANVGIIASWLLSDHEARLRFIAWYRLHQSNPVKRVEITEETVIEQCDRMVRIMGRALEQDTL